MPIARLPYDQNPRVEVRNEEVVVWAAIEGAPTGVAMSKLAAIDTAIAIFRCAGAMRRDAEISAKDGTISLYAADPPTEECAAKLIIEIEGVPFAIHLGAEIFVKIASDFAHTARRVG